MNKIWLVFRHEYLRHVGRKRFVISVLSLPLIILALAVISLVSALAALDQRPIGYVDHSGAFADAQIPPEESVRLLHTIEIVRFENENQATQAVKTGKIQGVFVIEENYLDTGAVRLIAERALKGEGYQFFSEFLQFNLLRGKPAELRARLLKGPTYIFKSLDDSREIQGNNFMALVIPIIAGVLLVVAINISGGYLLQAVTEEKENRTIEIVVTSVSPNQLMVGKIFGNLSVGLTHLLIWGLTGAGGVALAMRIFPSISGFSLDFSFLGLMLITFLPAFIMVAALMAMVGATVAEAQVAQQVAAIFSIPVSIPLWFLSFIIEKPNSPLSVGLSLFPLTAPMTLPMRGVLTILPAWQIALSIGLLVVCAIAALWLAGRAFRLGMLRYGKKLTFRELLSKERTLVNNQSGSKA